MDKEPGINPLLYYLLISFFLLSLPLYAQSGDSESEFGSVLYSEPQPFSLDARSAIYCIEILKNTPFIEVKDETGASTVVKVGTVWSLFLGIDEQFPEGCRRRYDIIVNGEALDWKNSFIEYGGEMLNLHLLFLYRNQHPGQDLEYRKEY